MSERDILDRFPEPIFRVRDGRLLYGNAAARGLLRELPPPAEPTLLPEPLAALAACPPPFLRSDMSLGARTFSVQGIPEEEGTLLVLRPTEADLSALLLGRLSDSLRPPLGNLLSAVSLLSDRTDGGNEDLLCLLNQQLFRLLRLTGNLAAARETLGREGDFFPAYVDAVPLCREMAEEMNDALWSVGRQIRFSADRDRIPLLADPAMLERLLANLLSNALKASPAGKPVDLALSVQGDQLTLSVHDEGPGIEPDLLGQVFSPGTRTLRLDMPGQGAGLGLPVARAIALRHGGSLLLECPPGGGTTVSVSLPLNRERRDPILTDNPPRTSYGAFSRTLVELSDVLPPSAFSPRDVE